MSNIKLNQVILKTDYSRRFPDPLNITSESEPYNIEHHVLLMRAIDVPSGISLEPNPRAQKIDHGIYKEIQSSLEDSGDPTFHLKNKGITMFAQRVGISDDKKVVTAYLGPEDGIADGGHTYQIVLDSISKNRCPENQYVRLEIITGIPAGSKVDISGGLNTAVQVQDESLENLKGSFEWVKKEIEDMPYSNDIAYMENEPGAFDIRDIVAFMTIFNVEHPDLKGRQPKEAYTSKSACLNLYKKNPDSYKMLTPLLKDILLLHDYIHLNVADIYNNDRSGHARGMTGVFEKKKRGKFKFIFSGQESEYRLYDGTFYPIFGSMRCLVEKKEGSSLYSWKLKTFEEIKEVFNVVAADLLTATYNTSVANGRKPNGVGKADNHWGYLYQMVKTAFLEYVAK